MSYLSANHMYKNQDIILTLVTSSTIILSNENSII